MEKETGPSETLSWLAARGYEQVFGGQLEQAAANLGLLQKRLAGLPQSAELLAELVRRCAQSPGPARTLNNLERFFTAAEEAEPLARLLVAEPLALDGLFALFGYSQFLSDVLIRHSEWLFWLADPEVLLEHRPPAVYRREVQATARGIVERNRLRDELCRLRRREMLRIGARDVLGMATAEEVSRELSDLAQAIISITAEHAFQTAAARFGFPMPEAASWQEESGTESADGSADFLSEETVADPELQGAGRELPQSAGMCVIGMGKLGGRELNFSSDIDLVFIYEAEGETTGRVVDGRRIGVVSNHQFFARVGEELVRLLSERGPEGNLYRVDMRLRPEGADGPLVRSLESFVAYLREQARDWERVAYLKARVMSGPSHLAERLYRVTDQFVFSDVDPARIVREVEALKLRIDREVISSDSYTRDVKRGYGGIREIEFVVAAMQIIYGKAHRALHVRNFFVAIQRLREVGLLAPEEMEFYEEAYAFLRTVEHRLQMAEEHQTHTFPAGGEALELVARRCGFLGAEQFLGRYEAIARGVHERFVRFFEQDVAEVDRTTRDLMTILDRGADPEEARAALRRQGLDSSDALRLLHDLAFGTREVFVSAGGQRCFEEMLPSLVRLTAAAPRPERVLPHFHSFMHAIKGMTYYYEVIAHHPDILKLLVTLFGTSDPLSQMLISRPEFFDALISTQALQGAPDDQGLIRERLRTALSARMLGRRLVMLRRAVQFETLLLALRFLLDLRPLRATLEGLSDVADLTLEVAMKLACQRVVQRLASRFGAAKEEAARGAEELEDLVRETFSVIALGKYGGRELNFFGDLDVVFVFSPLPEASALPAWARGWRASEMYGEVADALTHVLSEHLEGGRAFVLDARLRPHGAGAPVATELATYLAYLESEAEVWELQAMLRARCAWGRGDFVRQLLSVVEVRRKQLDPALVRQEVLRMRHRLEEAIPPTAEKTEFKRSAGGVVDAEFALQDAALRGRIDAELLEQGYFVQLETIAAMSAEPTRTAWRHMREAYNVLRRLETASRLVTGEGRSTLPGDGLAVAVARLMGFIGADALEALQRALTEVKQAMRESFGAVLGAPPQEK